MPTLVHETPKIPFVSYLRYAVSISFLYQILTPFVLNHKWHSYWKVIMFILPYILPTMSHARLNPELTHWTIPARVLINVVKELQRQVVFSENVLVCGVYDLIWKVWDTKFVCEYPELHQIEILCLFICIKWSSRVCVAFWGALVLNVAGLQLLAVHPMWEEFEASFRGVLEAVCLGLAFDKWAIKCSCKNCRVEAYWPVVEC